MFLVKYALVFGIAYLLFKRFGATKDSLGKEEDNQENTVKGGDYIDYEELDDSDNSHV